MTSKNIAVEKVKAAIDTYKGNIVAKRYFFRNIDLKWLQPLNAQRIFQHSLIDPINENEWPEGDYLLRVSEKAPEQVYEILVGLDIKETSNSRVYEEILEILSKITKFTDIEEVLDRVIAQKWFESKGRYHLLSYRVDDLVNAFIESKNYTLLGKLLEATLKFDKPVEYLDQEKRRYLDPQPYIEKHTLSNILEKLSTLEISDDADFSRALLALVNSLDQYLDIKFLLRSYETRDTSEDYSFVWKPSLYTDKDRLHQLNENLVVALRDFSVRNMTHFSHIYEELNKKKYRIFGRLKLYILSKNEPLDLKLCLSEILDNIPNENNIDELRELLKVSFSHFVEKDKETILNEIDNAFSTAKESYQTAHKAYLLKIIEDQLDESSKGRFSDVLASPFEYSTSFTSSGVRSGSNSRISKTQLEESNMNDVVKLLKSEETFYIENPRNNELYSPRGFGRLWQSVITEHIDLYVDNLDNFKLEEILPLYIYHLLNGIQDAVVKDSKINWLKVLMYIEDTLEKYKTNNIYVSAMEDSFEMGDKEEVLFAILRLIEKGLRGKNAMSIKFQTRVWRIINLINSIGIDMDESFIEKNEEDYFTYSINSIYGLLLHNVHYYALWVARKKDLSELPTEFQDFIRKFIKDSPNYKTGISVIGYFLPWTAMYAKKLFEDIKEHVLPVNNPEIRYVAWEAYIVNNVYGKAYQELREYYEIALSDINKDLPKRRYWADVKEKLVEHIVVAYMYDLDVKGQSTLLKKLIEEGDTSQLKHVLDFAGRAYVSPHKSNKGVVDSRMVTKLEKMWNLFLSKKLSSSVYETFGWWIKKDFYSSNKWLFDQAMKTLNLSKGYLDPDFIVLEQLVKLVRDYPLETVLMLEKLVKSTNKEKIYYFRDKEILAILSQAEKAKSDEVRAHSKEIRDTLVGFGFDQYAN